MKRYFCSKKHMHVIQKGTVVLKNDKAVTSTPTILMGCILFAVLLMIFCDSLKLASNGFKAREVSNTIAKQISVTGEITNDTLELARSCINEFEESQGNENRMVTVEIFDSEGGSLQLWGTEYLNIFGQGAGTETYELKNNTDADGKDRNKIQLGDTCKVQVKILNKESMIASPTDSISGLAGNNKKNSAIFSVNSTAVSQVYWKALDK